MGVRVSDGRTTFVGLRWLGLTLLLGLGSVQALAESSPARDSIDAIARDFLVLGLQHFRHDPITHLYIGPGEFKVAAEARALPLAEVRQGMQALRLRLTGLRETREADASRRRLDLDERLNAYITRAGILLGDMPTSFDEETRQLFGVVAPHYDEAHFVELTRQLEELVPGNGDLASRVAEFRERFVIPPDRLQSVIGAAMQECRRRTLAHFALPDKERVELHIDHDKPYVGFTYYRGDRHSDIHLNADVPVHIERAIELGCHEGYPGHHVHATLLEQELVRGRGWIEHSLISLFGPLAVIGEGVASHAEELVFTPDERLAFERDVLMPLAGLDSTDLERYSGYTRLIAELNFARNEAARKFLYDGMAKEDAIEWLMRYGLETRGTASQRLDFIEVWRSYVVTYNVGRKLVREYIHGRAGDDHDAQWRAYREIILKPLSPRDLLNATQTSGAVRANQGGVRPAPVGG